MRRLILALLIFTMSILSHANDCESGLLLCEAVNVTEDYPFDIIFSAEAGQRVRILVEGIEEFDPVVMVMSPDSNQLAYNDNISPIEGETQAGFSLKFPASGRYLIRVDTFNGVSEGQANLYIFDDTHYYQIEEEDNLTRWIAPLAEDSVFSIEQTFSAETPITITAKDSSGDFDPYLRVRDSEGNIIISNDDHNSLDFSLNIFDARIAEWQVPADDTYTIEVFDFLGRAGEVILEIKVEN